MSISPPVVSLEISTACAGRVRVASVVAAPVSVGTAGHGLIEEMESVAADLRAEHAGKTPARIPGVDAARRLYKAFGIDPTRTRPSSEALLRRAVAGKPLPRISNAVDLGNLCALRFLLPLGLYDAAAVQGRATLREGAPGEAFVGVRKDEVHLDGRPVLADEEGAFGNPTADSLRTAVRDETRSLWMVIFAPADFPRDVLARDAATAEELMKRHLGKDAEAVRAASTLIPDA